MQPVGGSDFMHALIQYLCLSMEPFRHHQRPGKDTILLDGTLHLTIEKQIARYDPTATAEAVDKSAISVNHFQTRTVKQPEEFMCEPSSCSSEISAPPHASH